MKHLPFHSVYRRDFEVVEQREGNLSLYPHTVQLPVILRAINMEFYGGLPDRIARVDQRGSGFDKIVLKHAASLFCTILNDARSDEVCLYPLPTPDLVYKVTLVQRIVETTRLGRCHRFRFYANDGFLPEICLGGKRLVFADHVMQRFSSRVPNNVGENLLVLLMLFGGANAISVPMGRSNAFIFSYDESILAFPYKETDTEFFFTTCLTINEMNSFEVELPPRAYAPNYGTVFKRPLVQHWSPMAELRTLRKRWQQKNSLPPPLEKFVPPQRFNWSRAGHWTRDHVRELGHGPESRLLFVDNIPGPRTLELKPKELEPRCNDLEIFKSKHPRLDWEAAYAIRYHETLPK